MAKLKKLKLSSLERSTSTDIEKDDRFYDRVNSLLSEEHYGHYVMAKGKEYSVRLYLSENKNEEFLKARIKKGLAPYPRKSKNNPNYLYTNHPEYQEFIKNSLELLVDCDSKGILCRRLLGMHIFLIQCKKINIKIKNIFEIDNVLESKIYKEYEKLLPKKKDKIALRSFFGVLEKIIPSFSAINHFDNLTYNATKALPSTIVHQLEYYAIIELKDIVKNVNEYQDWIEEFKNINLFSLPNLTKTYFDNIDLSGKENYQLNLKIIDLAIKIHKVNLRQWKSRRKDRFTYVNAKQKQKHHELIKLSKDGININITSEKMYAFWHKELLPQYPYDKEVIEKYSLIFDKKYIIDKYYEKFNKVIRIFNRRIYPGVLELYPLMLLLLIREGINSEVLTSWKITQKNDDSFIIGDEMPFCLSIGGFKGRGNKNIHVSINNNSEQRFYINFYLKWLEPVYLKSDIKHFFQYYSRSKGRVFKNWSSNSFTMVISSNFSFYKRYKIYDENNEIIKGINHKRLRPYSNYADHLKGYSNFERQVRKSHNNIDTQVHYENCTEWSEQKRYNIAKTQELLVGIFRGEIRRGEHFSTEFFEPGLFADCSNTKEPTFYGSKKLEDNENCTNWKKCLTQCDKACVIPNIHGKTIYSWIKYLEDEREKFYSKADWEKEYLLDYEAAIVVFDGFTDEEKKYAKENHFSCKNIVKERFKIKAKSGA